MEVYKENKRDPLCGISIDPETTPYKATLWGKTYFFCSEYDIHHFLSRPKIAYFSMDIGIESEIPTYSGGLGVLAGDTIKSCADLNIPLVAITLSSRKGYLKQKLTERGEQLEYPDEWDPSKLLLPVPVQVTLKIDERNVRVKAWLYENWSPIGSMVPVLFLDTNIEDNTSEDRQITDALYGGDEIYRLKQEIVLGIGGFRILEALNVNVKNYHMNEGHSSLLTLELLNRNNLDARKVREYCVFTTHTPIDAAFDKFSYDVARRLLGTEFPLDTFRQYAGQDRLNMTLLALNLSKYVNGVTDSHMELSRKMFPGYRINAITNGVHSYSWTCEYFRTLFDKYIPGWANKPGLLVRADEIPDDEVWQTHKLAKERLLSFVSEKTSVKMDPDKLILGSARRATGYKRGGMIFSDLERLKKANSRGNLQLIFAGKAHPRDQSGKEVIRKIFECKNMLKDDIDIAYLGDYDIDIAAKMTSGVDVWLNTPLPPYEASGTSGMKAAHNGVINFSVLDGWWLEGCIEGVTGWAIGPKPSEPLSENEKRMRELDDLYSKLEYIILPMFYENRHEWIRMMKNSISKVAYYFNSHRMIREYVTQAYMY